MVRLSGSILILVLSLVMVSFLSSVSYAFTPPEHVALQATVGPAGITPTATSPPPDGGDDDDDDGGGRRRGGGGPPSIPEPATIILTGLGLAGLAGYAARRKGDSSSDE